LIEVDFPHHKEISPALHKANSRLSHAFNIKGLPAVVILSPEGQELGRLGYRPGGPKGYISRIETIAKSKSQTPVAKTTSTPSP
jgi:protein disulfide-isomerase